MDKQLQIEIEHDCIALSNSFAYHLDRREYQQLADLFAPEGVWIRHYIRLEGREQIVKALEERPAEQFTRHMTTSFHFTQVDETTAKSVSCNMSYYSFEADQLPAPYKPQQGMLLDFVDIFTKTDQGWRFLERDTQMVLVPPEVYSQLNDHK